MLVLTFEQDHTVANLVFLTAKTYKDLARARKMKVQSYRPEFVKTLYEDENCYVIQINGRHLAGVNVAVVPVSYLVEKVKSLGIDCRFYDID